MYIIKITICLPSFPITRRNIFSTASLSINVLLAVFECVEHINTLSESFRDPL